MSDNDAETGRWYARAWFLVPLGLVLILALALLLLPYGVRWYLSDWLRDQGVEGVEIGHVDVNPFTGFVGIDNVSLEGDSGASTAVRLEINLTWQRLPGRRVMLSRIVLEDARLRIHRTENQGWIVAAIVFGARKAVATTRAAEEATGWGFGFGGADLRNVTIQYLDPVVEQEVLIEEARLDAFSTWNPDRATDLSATVVVDGTRVRLVGQGTPFADSHDGYLDVEHGALDLAPFESVLALAGLRHLRGEMTADYRLRLEWAADRGLNASLDGRLGFDGLGLETTAVAGAAGSLGWKGPASVHTDAEGVTVSLQGVVDGRDLDLVVNGARGPGVAEAAAAGPELVEADAGEPGAEGSSDPGAADPARAAAATPLVRAGAGSLRWDFDGRLVASGSRLEVRGGGALAGTDLAVAMAPPQRPDGRAAAGEIDLSVGKLDADGRAVSVTVDEGLLEVDWEGGAMMDDARLQLDRILAGMESGRWEGRLAALTETDARRVTLDGRLELDGATAGVQGVDADTRLGRVEWEGSAVAALTEAWQVSVGGAATLEDLTVARRGGGPRLAEVASLRSAMTADEGGHTVLQDLAAKDVRLLAREGEGADWIIVLPEATLDGGRVGLERIDLGVITLRDARVWYELDADGEAEYKRLVAGLVTREATPREAGLAFALGGIELTGGGALRFVDRSVKPVVDIAIRPLDLSVGTMDTANPEAATALRLDAGIGKYTELSFEGSASPLADSLSAGGQGGVSALNLPILSPYARDILGYGIERGTLEGTLDLAIDRGYLDSTATLTLRQLKVRKLRPEESEEIDREIGASLDTALALLEDDDETIQLDVPLKGRLGQLELSAADAVEQVVQKALTTGIKTAAVAYFAPLWPALAVGKILDLASALSFRPVAFPPGDATLGQPQREYLDQMARLLGDRPKVSAVVCGVAVASDLRALEEAGAVAAAAKVPVGDAAGDRTSGAAPAPEQRLGDLARRRQEAVVDHLIRAGISKSRLVTCDPQVRREDDGQPRVELGV